MRLTILILSLLPSAWAFECPRGFYDLKDGDELDFMETCTQEMFCKEHLNYPSSSVWFWGCDEDGVCAKEGCNETLCCSYTGHVAPITKLSTTTTVATPPITTTLTTLSTTTTVYKVTSCPTGDGEERVECDEPTYCYARWVDGIMKKGCAENGECPDFGIHGDIYCSYSGTLTLDPPSDMITEATTTTTVETESAPPITSSTPSVTTTIPETEPSTESGTPSSTTTTEAATTARTFECPSGNYEMSTGKMPTTMQTCKKARFCVESLFSDGKVWNGCDENMRCLKHGCKGRLCCSKTGNIAHTAPWFRHPTTTAHSTSATEATTTMGPETVPSTPSTTTELYTTTERADSEPSTPTTLA